jgi:hypothetical protein
VIPNSCLHSWFVVIYPSRYVLVFSYHVGIDLAPRVTNTSSYTLTLFSSITQAYPQVYGVLVISRLIQLTLPIAYAPTNACFFTNYQNVFGQECRSQWPRGLKRRSAAARLLGLWVRIPRGAWTFVCCKCYVLSDRDPCDKLITRPEESY